MTKRIVQKQIPQENVDDRKLRGRPGDKLETTEINNAIARIDEQIAMGHAQMDLLKKQTEVMKKYPKPLKAQFAYEESEEWLDIARAHHDMNLTFKLLEKEIDIKGLEQQKDNFVVMLEDRKDGIQEEKSE